MKKLLNISILILLSFMVMPVTAKEIYKGQINITSGEIRQKGDSVYVHMMIDISGLKIDRNRALTLTPILTNGSQQRELPDVLINGSTRDKAYKRSVALGGYDNIQNQPYTAIKLDKKSRGVVHYWQIIAYERWMDTAHLDIREDLCGCGGHEQEIAVERVIDNMPPVVTYELIPQLAYIKPEAEDVKSRSEKWESFLDFPVNKTNIKPDYMNNPRELSDIQKMLNTIKEDNNITISRVTITGFASPEGGIANNERLAKGRADEFKKYLTSKVNFPADIYNIEYGGENWDGLVMALEASTMTDKDAILDIINNTNDINARKDKLKAFKNGVPYRQMLTEIYPKLRKVVSTAQYTVRSFNVDEAKAIINTRPQQLSLDEMFQVANSYPVGSGNLTEVFETAVRMYPNNEVANLNAGAAALSSNNIQNAEKYLQKADRNSAEYMNNMGVLYILKGDLLGAKEQFSRAAQLGLEIAKYNLQEVEKKIENDALR